MYSNESKEHLSTLEDDGQHQHADRPEIETAPHASMASAGRALTIVSVVVLVLILEGVFTLADRFRDAKELAMETERNAIPNVAVVHPSLEKADETLMLPSTLQAFQESPIYARTNGYLVEWKKDIGSKVAKGELLARIDAPELDQELMQARATREQVAAQLQLAQMSVLRWQSLRSAGAVSQQETDTQVSTFEQAKANVAAADANVRRLEQLESFKNIYAPFGGVLTRRNVDVGALINSGAGGRELFVISQIDPIRVFVNVPQAYANTITIGMPAEVEVQEMPGVRNHGKVARTADAIDPNTRTLLTEVDIPNTDGRLLPGSYAQIHLRVNSDGNKLTVPVNAMLFRSEGPRVAVVDSDTMVKLRPITIGRDYGGTLEILAGLQQSDRVIINPSDSLEENQKVKVVPSDAKSEKKRKIK